MIQLDFSRRPGEWEPNRFGGNENLEAIAFLQPAQRKVHERVPRHPHDRRGLDGPAQHHAARRASAASGSTSSGTWAGSTTRSTIHGADPPSRSRRPTTKLTFRMHLRLQRELPPAALARRRRPRQAVAPGQDAGRRLAEVRQPAAALRLHVRPAGQEAAVHGRRVRPVAGMEPRHEPRLAPARRAAASAGCGAGCAT